MPFEATRVNGTRAMICGSCIAAVEETNEEEAEKLSQLFDNPRLKYSCTSIVMCGGARIFVTDAYDEIISCWNECCPQQETEDDDIDV